MFAAHLDDPQLLDEFKKQIAERVASGEEHRPPLLGFSREAAGLHGLTVSMTRLHRTLAKNLAIPLPLGPLVPADRLEQLADAAEVIDLFAEVDLAQQNWREKHG